MTMVKILYSEYIAHHAVDFTKLMICQFSGCGEFRNITKHGSYKFHPNIVASRHGVGFSKTYLGLRIERETRGNMDTDLREIRGFIIVDTQGFFLRGSVDPWISLKLLRTRIPEYVKDAFLHHVT